MEHRLLFQRVGITPTLWRLGCTCALAASGATTPFANLGYIRRT